MHSQLCITYLSAYLKDNSYFYYVQCTVIFSTILHSFSSFLFSFFLFFLFFFFYGHICGTWEFPSQGQNPTCSCNLHHSCINNRSFNPPCGARNQTCASAATQATAVRFLNSCAREGTPFCFLFKKCWSWSSHCGSVG